MGYIAEGNPSLVDEYMALATHDHVVQCAYPFGSHRLITTQNTVMAAEQGAVNIRTHEVRGLMPIDSCVFAKSCVSVPAGSTEAGTASEPAKNFGSVALLGTTGATTAEGAVLLGRASGTLASQYRRAWQLGHSGSSRRGGWGQRCHG